MNYLIKCALAIFLLFFVALATTSLGVPYKYSREQPRLRRIIGLHADRKVFDFNGELQLDDTGLFIQSLDYRSTADLPAHSFMQGTAPPTCDHTRDEYCRLPYYTAIHELFPPTQSLWVSVPSKPFIPHPINVTLVERERIGERELKLTFEMRGGYDKMSLHVTPLGNYALKEWSFTPLDMDSFGRRTTYFVFLTYGFEAPEVRRFTILLEDEKSSVLPDPNVEPSLELAAASHHAHGRYQNSDTMLQLRHLISNRRLQPQQAIGWWKWGITMVGGVSEITVRQY